MTVRYILAGAAVLLYGLLCAAIAWREHRCRAQARAAAAALAPARDGVTPLLVAFASQTGHAEEIAWETARLLHAAGEPVDVRPLDDVDAAVLAAAGRALFVVSTYGEGDAPDNAAGFADLLAAAPPAALAGLRYGLLALGDREYARFCGFGRQLDRWLRTGGATPWFDALEMDGIDAATLRHWRQQLGHVAVLDESAQAPAWEAGAPFAAWTLAERRLLNPGSQGGPVYHIELAPPAGGTAPQWESGDLVQVQLPDDAAHPRDYSIASLAADGRVHLLVRLARREDGTPGRASHWLTTGAPPGGAVALRLRAHRSFRLEDNAARPLILIGNGTGLAGLRGHLRARAAAGAAANWLVFGERQRAHDFHHRGEIAAWQAAGHLARLDLAFSRDGAERVYVQDRLREAAGTLRDWVVQRGAAIYVCGSLQGMAQGVDDALRAALGEERMAMLTRSGRYRRDVY
ncbi:MAG: Sulfite reductase [NADPH] flavoprotein alpha-component [Xylophilus sp.]|nr:sulfite reductase subunit alpha [Xylophilus sp.]KAF1048948.1 MAG: Sulfite reductase [NADPH] flavoprotein alpha-component [Xylophilus sp.]